MQLMLGCNRKVMVQCNLKRSRGLFQPVAFQVKQGDHHQPQPEGNAGKILVLVVVKKFHHHPEAVGQDPEQDGGAEVKIGGAGGFDNQVKGKKKRGYHHHGAQPLQLQHPAAVFYEPEHDVQVFILPYLL